MVDKAEGVAELEVEVAGVTTITVGEGGKEADMGVKVIGLGIEGTITWHQGMVTKGMTNQSAHELTHLHMVTEGHRGTAGCMPVATVLLC
jgi:hypothetical protein